MLKSPKGCGRVLVVEDHEPSRISLARLLKLNGRTVDTASTIDEAIDKLDSFGPHCVILDLRVGTGRGEQLLKLIREQQRPIRVNVVTGSGDHDDIRGLESLRPDHVMFKPINFSDLLFWIDGGPAIENN